MGEGSGENLPLSVSLDLCIVRPLLAQYHQVRPPGKMQKALRGSSSGHLPSKVAADPCHVAGSCEWTQRLNQRSRLSLMTVALPLSVSLDLCIVRPLLAQYHQVFLPAVAVFGRLKLERGAMVV